MSWRTLTDKDIRRLADWAAGKDTMEKYGVATPKKPAGEKTAGKDDVCPKDGHKLDKTSPQPHCPTHGTEPFEKKGK